MANNSFLSGLVLESSLRICAANEDFSAMLGDDLDFEVATEDFSETWDNVKEAGSQVYEKLLRIINALLVKVVELWRKFRKEQKGNYTCKKKYYTAAKSAHALLNIKKANETATDYEKVKKIRERLKSDESKNTVSVSAAEVDKWIKQNQAVLKKLEQLCKNAKKKAITAKYSTADRAADVKAIRQRIAVCNAAYSICAQVIIHGGEKGKPAKKGAAKGNKKPAAGGDGATPGLQA